MQGACQGRLPRYTVLRHPSRKVGRLANGKSCEMEIARPSGHTNQIFQKFSLTIYLGGRRSGELRAANVPGVPGIASTHMYGGTLEQQYSRDVTPSSECRAQGRISPADHDNVIRVHLFPREPLAGRSRAWPNRLALSGYTSVRSRPA